MKPGRELDALVAEKVTGLEDLRWRPGGCGKPRFQRDWCEKHYREGC